MNKTMFPGWMKVVAGGALLAGAVAVQAQHGHLNAGATTTATGSQVVWANGSLFADSSGYVGAMPKATSGVYMGYYNSGPTFTALPATVANGGPSGGASALGSFLEFSYTLVAAPDGGSFSFWDHGALAPTSSMTVGQTSGLFALSGGEDNPAAGTVGGDPYGHIHGRRFTADLPGDYLVSFQAFDTSVNGVGGGPIHTPSAPLSIRFRVIPEPAPLAMLAVGLVLVAGVLNHRRNG